MSRWVTLAVFLVLTLGGGLAIGTLTGPDQWFAALQKPAFNPPNWVFAPVWSTLYVLIAIAGWRCWERDSRSVPMALWWLQLVLNFAWTPIFFSLHAIGAALLVIVGLLAVILIFVATSWRRDRAAAMLFLPYAAWVAFAAVLNAAIYQLN